MKERLRRFMAGRYGHDRLNGLLSAAALILMVMSMFAGQVFIYPAALVLLAVTLFRMFSKNTAKRSRENRFYLKLREKPERWCRNIIKRFKQRKTHVFYKCPSCRIWIRVPKGRGLIAISCPKCRASFDKTT